MFAEIGGPLDILVNNAGISGMEGDPDRSLERQERSMRQAEERQAGGPIKTFVDVTVELSDEEWQRMLDVHLNGTFYCSREALKIMNQQGSGCILNMGSIMGTAGGSGAPHYCAAKAGILGFTRALAREFVELGFVAHLTCVDPRQVDRALCGRRFDMALLADLPPSADPCGENGEFHTFVSAGPIFAFPIGVRTGERVERDGFVFCDLLASRDPASAARGLG